MSFYYGDDERREYFDNWQRDYGLEQLYDTDPEYADEISEALWDGWFASDEELEAKYGYVDHQEMRELFYEYDFSPDDIDWADWREMMGY